jgi:hypothetical protein
MKRKARKDAVPTAAVPVDISTADRAALIAAYQAGVIAAWKHDGERGYRLTTPSGQDDYVEVTKLTKYLEKLGGA